MNAVDELNFLLGIGPPRPQLPITLQRSGYTAVRTLGKGSFGQALLVFHKGRQMYFVVKHVNMANMNSRQRKDAHNEISVLQQLRHPNIVRYEECFEEPPHLYIVMEHADGGDLFTHLAKLQRRRPMHAPLTALGEVRRGASDWLTEAQIISLFVQTTMAVKHMHDRRLLHRDIKSQNVFLTKQHVVKLGDFGITTVLQNTVAMASTMCGTPCYFSPELCMGRPYNNKSDVWALGVLLYELCTGHVPFESTTMKSLMREIVNKEPPRIPPAFSDEIWKLIQWMLQKDPKKRPDAGQILHAPVLMRHVPDIIAQLEQAHSLSAGAPAPPGSAGDPTAASGGSGGRRQSSQSGVRHDGGEAGAASSPYYQLLQQQAPQRPHSPAVQGRNPFASDAAGAAGSAHSRTPPTAGLDGAGEATAQEEAYVAAYRRRQAQDKPSPRAEVPSSQPKASVSTSAEAKSKAPTLSPQLRAALNKGKDNSIDGGGNNKKPAVTRPPTPPQRAAARPGAAPLPRGGPGSAEASQTPTASAALPAPPSSGAVGGAPRAEKPSIEALLARFDLEKKRIQLEKQQEQANRERARSDQANPGSAPAATNADAKDNGSPASKKPKPLSVADQETLMTIEAATAAVSALGTLRTPSAAVVPAPLPSPAGAPPTPQTHQRASAAAQAAPPKDSSKDGGSASSSAGAVPGAQPPRADAVAADPNAAAPHASEKRADGRDLDAMMKEMHTYFHRYQQKQRGAGEVVAGAAPAEAKGTSSRTSAPAVAAAGPLRPPDPPRRRPSGALDDVHAANDRLLSPTDVPGLFDDPTGAHLDVADLQQQHDKLRRQKKHTSTSEASTSRVSASPETATLGSSGRRQRSTAGEGEATTPGTSPSEASSLSASSRRRHHPPSATPQDVFMSSLNRKYQQVASVNAMARPPAAEPPSPPVNRLLPTSGRQGLHPSSPSSPRSPSSPAGPTAGATVVAPDPTPKAAVAVSGEPVTTSPSLPQRCDTDAHLDTAAAATAAEAADVPFRGQCLCGAVRLVGWFSTIYGSFVCNCQACCRLSGSTLGVEWLHLPNVTCIEDVLCVDEDGEQPTRLAGGSAAEAAGSGVAAVTALQRQQQAGPQRRGSQVSAAQAMHAYKFEMLVDAMTSDDDDNDGIEERSGGSQYVACFATHFCACCGTNVGFQHDGLDGLLLPKPALDEESEHVLRRFARTVVVSDTDDDAGDAAV